MAKRVKDLFKLFVANGIRSLQPGLLLFPILILVSCSETRTPKPRGYFRFDLPEKEYRMFDSTGCPYTFEYPVYGEIAPNGRSKDPYLFDLTFPRYEATIYLSYIKVNDNLGVLLEDAHNFLYKHSVKADAIEDSFYDNPEAHTAGFLFDIGGNAATSVQFFVTDSTKHFLRGSLYFYSTPNRDSLDPLIRYFREDIIHLMETVRFR